MGLARMGAVFPNPKQGWAFAGSDPMQAIGLDKFVERLHSLQATGWKVRPIGYSLQATGSKATLREAVFS
eukprot:833442-Pelagomonas_calceolata.AAC.3